MSFLRQLLNYAALSFPQSSSPPDKTDDWYESQNASKDGKQQECELVSNPVAQIYSIKRKSKAEGLAEEVEKLSDVVALFAVAVGCVRVAGGGDDLEAERRYTCTGQP